MKQRQLIINYCEYDTLAELPAEEQELMREAMRATALAYAPYSHFSVGAAVRMSDGSVVLGANQENVAYPSGLCAERSALFHARIEHPGAAVAALAVVGRDAEGRYTEAAPCGACRQVMAEYEQLAGSKMTVLCYLDGGKIRRIEGVCSLLPFAFHAELE